MRGTPSADRSADWFPYKDEGCELCPTCLNCTLPLCKYDDPRGEQVQLRRERNEAMRDARDREGLAVWQVAERFEVCERTAWRVLAARSRT